MNIPATFKKSDLAPSDEEIEWLWCWLQRNEVQNNAKNVLEFGCGITTLILQDALHPQFLISIEDYQPCIDMVRKHLHRLNFAIFKNWTPVDKYEWNVVLVDSSSCGKWEEGYHRDMVVKAILPHMAPDGIIILHDWKKVASKRAKRVLDKEGWELLDACYTRNGWGIYANT